MKKWKVAHTPLSHHSRRPRRVVTRSGAPRRCVHGTASVPRGGSTGGSREVKMLALGARGSRVTVTLAKPAGTALPPTSVNGLVQLQGPD